MITRLAGANECASACMPAHAGPSKSSSGSGVWDEGCWRTCSTEASSQKYCNTCALEGRVAGRCGDGMAAQTKERSATRSPGRKPHLAIGGSGCDLRCACHGAVWSGCANLLAVRCSGQSTPALAVASGFEGGSPGFWRSTRRAHPELCRAAGARRVGARRQAACSIVGHPLPCVQPPGPPHVPHQPPGLPHVGRLGRLTWARRVLVLAATAPAWRGCRGWLDCLPTACG